MHLTKKFVFEKKGEVSITNKETKKYKMKHRHTDNQIKRQKIKGKPQEKSFF